MYKIFVNEKPLTISEYEIKGYVNIPYETENTFAMAFDMLFHSQKKAINIFYFDEEFLWKKFQKFATPVYAAGGVVENNKHEYLFIKRNGKWDLPKGHVEKGETYEQTALREVKEECAIDNLSLKNPLCTTYHVYFDKKYYLKVVYWFTMFSDSTHMIPQKEENIEVVDWFSLEQIPDLMNNTYENIKHMVNEYILNKG